MIYPCIFLFLVTLCIIGHRSNNGSLWTGSLAGAFVAFVISVSVILGGIFVYPTLVGIRAEVISLKDEIDTIRSAHYKVESGYFVGGSLDNLKQSSILSEYIRNYADKKAYFNRLLKEAKANKITPSLWWFSNGAFISSKVLELEELK